MDFTPQQKYSLLSKMGYTGSVDNPEMDAFIQSNPAVAARMGKFDRALKRGFQTGGLATGVASNFLSAGGGLFDLLFDGVSDTSEKPDLSVAPDLDTAQQNFNQAQKAFIETQRQLEEDPENESLIEQQEELAKHVQRAQQDIGLYQSQQMQQAPSAPELVTTASQTPEQMVTQAEVSQIGQATPEQLIQQGTGQAQQTQQATAATTPEAAQAQAPEATQPAQMQATQVTPQVQQATSQMEAAQGQVSPEAQVTAAQGEVSPGALAEGAKFDEQFIKTVQASRLKVTPEQLATVQGQDEIAPSSKIAQSSGINPAVAAQGTVSRNELPEPAQIRESEIAQAEAVVSDGQLSQDATAVAAKLKSFSVGSETLAEAAQGDVNAQDTVQGQLANLMKQFDDGTPAWAAGAIRAANAAMAARGLGGSSMAGAAIVQAAMESAIPIASQDAQTFARMNLSNLDRRQQTALANAAAQQGLALQNLNNEQQAALQNSANAFQLQSQNLSNMQQTVLANAQIKSSLQGQNLSNRQQANLATAARYAEVANINLNNRQQTALQNNANNLQIELNNLSNRQQSYIANAQLEAALQNKVLDNQQQVAIQNAARFSEAANIEFRAEQQAQINNSELMKTIGLAELNAEQAATLQNAANLANMDMANLNNRQQAAVQNARSFLQMDMANLNNEQQTAIFKSQQNINAMLSDQAAENAAEQFNAASENQVNQFFADLQSNISRFNADQKNAIEQFNAGEENTTSRFNAQLEAAREQFNAQNSLVIAQANAKWRQDISTRDTAAQNEANLEAARTANVMTRAAMDEVFQRERDLMSFAFQSGESALDREMNMLLADKRNDLARWQAEQEEEAARGYLITRMGGDLLFGGSGGGGLVEEGLKALGIG
jgi:hypothetical protein